MTIPANVVRVLMHSWLTHPLVRIAFHPTGKIPGLNRASTENTKAVLEVCREVETALRSGQGEVYLFPWGWSYVPDQRTE